MVEDWDFIKIEESLSFCEELGVGGVVEVNVDVGFNVVVNVVRFCFFMMFIFMLF